MQVNKLFIVSALLLSSALVACGSSNNSKQPEGSSQSAGTVNGAAFTPAAALFTNVSAALATVSTAVDPNAVAGDFNTVTGDFNSQVAGDPNITTIAPGDANSTAPGNANGTVPQLTLLGLTSITNACDDQQANQDARNESALLFVLANVTQPGTYNVTVPGTAATATSPFLPRTAKRLASKVTTTPATGGTVSGSFVKNDAQCNSTPTAVTSGTVTITTIDSSKSLVGSYDVTLASGDKLSGTFNADNCPLPTTNSATAPTCGN